MGKLVFIVLLSLIVIFGIMFVTTGDRMQEIPNIVSQKQAGIIGQKLGNFALAYGIKQLLNGNVVFVDSTKGSINDFEILVLEDGSVDSIVYKNEPNGSIGIYSYVKCTVAGTTYKHSSSTKIVFSLDDSGLSNITAAIVSGGSIEVKAHALIDGSVVEDSTFNFEEILGMTQEEVIAEAQSNNSFISYPANNEPMPDSLTWMDGNLKIQSQWTGNGILIVNGDLTSTAQVEFNGILIVFGTLTIGAHSNISGSIFVVGDTSAGAHATISFDADSIEDAFNNLPVSVNYEILEWSE
ncbi:MAG: hypothetical protein U9P79_04160 [Candidatus Cloacimonadota bacterium]|nr:hypothetical protein [Candidatus Cloacimonadota bacterium]